MQVALWSITDGQPARLEPRREFLEIDLETWIERHPDLAMEGLRWVGRQIVLPDRSRLDLVGVSREGALVIAELKRGHLGVWALKQAMHCVFLAREVEEHEQPSEELTPRQRGRRAASVDRIQDRARDFGVGPSIDAAIDLAEELGLRAKPWPKSITVVPPFTRGKTLIYLSPKADGRVGFGYSVDNLVELYDADADHVARALGGNWEDLPPGELDERLRGFRDLMLKLLSDGESPT